MVAESVAAKIFKIGSVVFELWPFYLIKLWGAFVSITNQSTESTAGRAYMQIYNGWQARIQVFWLEGRSSARSPARSRTEPGGEPGY